jgi:hypothetical protein
MNGKARNACSILVSKSEKKKKIGDLGLVGKITVVYDVSHRNIAQGCGICASQDKVQCEHARVFKQASALL